MLSLNYIRLLRERVPDNLGVAAARFMSLSRSRRDHLDRFGKQGAT